MHLIISLFYLLLIVLLVFAYLSIFLILIRYFVFSLRKYKITGFSKKLLVPDKKIMLKGTRLIVLFSIVLTLVTGQFLFERERWIKDRSSHLESKNYLVTGMVLLQYRTVGAAFIYPERLICRPFVWLQRAISSSGRKLIPKEDGEHAIWEYFFELAVYINRFHVPQTEAVYKLINSSEFILKKLSSNANIRDEYFNNEIQYLIYPLTGFYYSTIYKSKYFLRPQTKRYYEGLHKDPNQVKKLKQIVGYFLEKELEWGKHPQVIEYLKLNPDIELTHIASVIILLHDILRYQIFNLEYHCEDKYVKLYHNYVERYTGEDSPYFKVDRQMQRRLDNPIIYHGATHNFIGHSLCGFPKLKGYNIRVTRQLKVEGKGWWPSYKAICKKILPEDKQRELLGEDYDDSLNRK